MVVVARPTTITVGVWGLGLNTTLQRMTGILNLSLPPSGEARGGLCSAVQCRTYTQP